jgi:hypothetical protein
MIAVREGPGVVTVMRNSREWCRVQADRNVDFFTLDTREAFDCVEFWHRTRGLISWLRDADADVRCATIVRTREMLATALAGAAIGPLAHPPLTQVATVDEPRITLEQDVAFGGPKLLSLLQQYYDRVEIDYPPASLPPNWRQVVRQPARSPEALREWLRLLCYLTLDTLPILPGSPIARSPNRREVLALIRVVDGLLRRQRHADYHVIARFRDSFSVIFCPSSAMVSSAFMGSRSGGMSNARTRSLYRWKRASSKQSKTSTSNTTLFSTGGL